MWVLISEHFQNGHLHRKIGSSTSLRSAQRCISIISCPIHFLAFFKGQINSEWIDEFIISPKMPTKIYPDFCPERGGQKPGKNLVGIFGETMTSLINPDLS